MATNLAKFDGVVNFQRAQYEEIWKNIEATTKFEGLLEVVGSQANDIEDLKASIKTIQTHVVSDTVSQNKTDRELALIPLIRDKQDLLMLHMADLIKTLNGNDAKKEEEGGLEE